MLRLFGKEKKNKKTSLLMVQEDKMIKMKPKSELLMDVEEGAKDLKTRMARMESRRMRRRIGKITWLPAIFLLLLFLPSSSASAEEQQLEGSKVKAMKSDHE